MKLVLKRAPTSASASCKACPPELGQPTSAAAQLSRAEPGALSRCLQTQQRPLLPPAIFPGGCWCTQEFPGNHREDKAVRGQIHSQGRLQPGQHLGTSSLVLLTSDTRPGCAGPLQPTHRTNLQEKGATTRQNGYHWLLIGRKGLAGKPQGAATPLAKRGGSPVSPAPRGGNRSLRTRGDTEFSP